MKILVDELPGWRGDCPFSEETLEHREWIYMCKLTNKYCNLDRIENECQMLKKLK